MLVAALEVLCVLVLQDVLLLLVLLTFIRVLLRKTQSLGLLDGASQITHGLTHHQFFGEGTRFKELVQILLVSTLLHHPVHALVLVDVGEEEVFSSTMISIVIH